MIPPIGRKFKLMAKVTNPANTKTGDQIESWCGRINVSITSSPSISIIDKSQQAVQHNKVGAPIAANRIPENDLFMFKRGLIIS